ncbi:membrane protein [Porphyromonas crevioricanis]|uniref:Membrane protein n=4 Tax=Porphyromonas crevioricanis TaxID=393921 RepID=A0AB34PH77_9PORP|nr:membrane protein [Porphyromonas crevioricanis]KGN94137.1 membrane protein [Porphyromonas crevioricanis]GAD04664.1 hypothetical protein PORCRE_355 [Porphyromonas crevioricanis JCM 15906]GAD07177.1 hypothetical protein PORCAN_795 [Porphyromonas crevioricanis JCM 13913]
MSSDMLNAYIISVSKYLPSHEIPSLRKRLEDMSDSQIIQLQAVEMKDPTTLLIVSIFAGTLGIDRFMLGQVGLGVAKLLTFGGCGIWAIIDLFLITDATREANMKRIHEAINLL